MAYCGARAMCLHGQALLCEQKKKNASKRSAARLKCKRNSTFKGVGPLLNVLLRWFLGADCIVTVWNFPIFRSEHVSSKHDYSTEHRPRNLSTFDQKRTVIHEDRQFSIIPNTGPFVQRFNEIGNSMQRIAPSAVRLEFKIFPRHVSVCCACCVFQRGMELRFSKPVRFRCLMILFANLYVKRPNERSTTYRDRAVRSASSWCPLRSGTVALSPLSPGPTSTSLSRLQWSRTDRCRQICLKVHPGPRSTKPSK